MNRNKLCDQCPKKKQRDIFKRSVHEVIEIKLGAAYVDKFRFDFLESLVYNTASLEGRKPHDLSYKSSHLLSVYITERELSRERIK